MKILKNIPLFVPLVRWTRRNQIDYRESLYAELKERLGDKRPFRILEIGPKDGADTRRLLSLNPDTLVLVDLPDKSEQMNKEIQNINDSRVELLVGNLMYEQRFLEMEPFDVVWCTGVLYHNPEQLRMIRALHDLTKPGGLMVMETATARKKLFQNENCVEIWHPVTEADKHKYHISMNVTHMPSKLAVRSWMEMVGFCNVVESRSHKGQNRALARTRAAYIGHRLESGESGVYYRGSTTRYEIGKSL